MNEMKINLNGEIKILSLKKGDIIIIEGKSREEVNYVAEQLIKLKLNLTFKVPIVRIINSIILGSDKINAEKYWKDLEEYN